MAVDNPENPPAATPESELPASAGGRPARRFLLILGIICGLALLLRVAMLDEFLRENVIAEQPPSDGEVYWKMAGRMAEGAWTGETPFLSAPLYPYLLGLIRTLGGGLLSVYIVQILLHLGTALLLGWTARLRFGTTAGLLAAPLFLLLTEPAVSSTRIMPNTLQVLLVVVLWWRWAAAAERDMLRRRDVVTVGALLGLLALAYVPALLLVPLFGLWAWVRGRSRRGALGTAALSVLGTIVVISPATLHNLLLHGEFIPITAHGGITLRQGNGPTAVGIGDVIPNVSLRRDRMHEDAAEVFRNAHGRDGTWREIDGHFRREVLSYWLGHPLATLKLFARKLYLYLTARNYDMIMPTVIERELHINDRAALAPLATPWLMGAAFVGLFTVLRRPTRFAPEWLLCLLPLLVTILFFYAPRYRLPSVPLLCGLAAYAVVCCRRVSPSTVLRIALILVPLPLWLVNIRLGIDAPDFNRTFFVRALSEATVQAGNRRAAAGNSSDAEQRYRKALALWPGNALAHQQLGVLYGHQRRMVDAVRAFEQAIRLRPDLLPPRFYLYNALCLQQRYADAAAAMRQALLFAPEHVRARLALAWLLATCPDERVRNGAEALRHAQAAQRLTAGNHHDVLDVLAAAQAELGEFERAVQTASEALARARQRDEADGAAGIARRLARYRQNEPCRAVPRSVPPGSRR